MEPDPTTPTTPNTTTKRRQQQRKTALPGATAAAAAGPAAGWVRVERHMRSRILYASPVCVLSASDAAGRRRTAMVLSWVAATDNGGRFMASMNGGRRAAALLFGEGGVGESGGGGVGVGTAAVESAGDGGPATDTSEAARRQSPMAPRPRFVLNVATAGMEAQLLAIGAGRRGIWAAASAAAADNNAASAAVDAGAETHVSEIHQPKLDALGLRACAPGRPGTPAELPAADGQLHAVFGLEGDGFCAHAVCVVDLVVERHGHLVLLCEVEEAWARREYWDGRCLAPKRMRRRKRRAGGGDEEGEVEGEHGNNGEEGRELPGLLAFMGSKRFAVMEPMVDGDEEGADPDTTG